MKEIILPFDVIKVFMFLQNILILLCFTIVTGLFGLYDSLVSIKALHTTNMFKFYLPNKSVKICEKFSIKYL